MYLGGCAVSSSSCELADYGGRQALLYMNAAGKNFLCSPRSVRLAYAIEKELVAG